ncbi:MAG TPA: SDR family NAD(P)-dependent oxidoreductase [Terriglobia bacterium]|nr:SDR family NAD(P)-dependent oxidoreductase [Terriglobia bacterium]
MSAAISMRDVAGKIIIITGASSGIGRATAIALARESAQLVMVARREHRLAALEEEIRTAGGIATSMVLDLRQRDQVETMIRSTHARFGRIDVLINNAGFGFWGTVEKTPAPVVREIFDLNFEAPLLASQLAIPIMKAQGGGHIINVSSVVGKRGLPLSGIYCATKFALQGISESLRLEVKDSNIDVSIVSPAATRSEFGDHVRHGDVRYRFKPTGPVQSAEDVAAAIVACIKKPKLEVYPSRLSRLLVWGNALVPGVVDKIIIRYFRDRIRTAKQQS